MDVSAGEPGQYRLSEVLETLRAPDCPDHGTVRLGPHLLDYQRPRPLATAIETLGSRRGFTTSTTSPTRR